MRKPLQKESLVCLESLTVTDPTESQTLDKGVETATSTPIKEELLVEDDKISDCPIYQTSGEVEGVFDFDLDCK